MGRLINGGSRQAGSGPGGVVVDLAQLGFDPWFEERYRGLHVPGCRPARVSSVYGDRYRIVSEIGEVNAELSGKCLFSVESPSDYPCVGDWVAAQYVNEDSSAIIHETFPRKSCLRRKAAGKKVDHQMIAANIDVAFVVQSCDSDFNLRRLERYLVMIHDGNIEPVVVLTKTDLVPKEELECLVEKVKRHGNDCDVVPISTITGEGLSDFSGRLTAGKSYCLIGSSGVGKTTLINHLVGGQVFETKSVRESDGRGRHTTSRRQLVMLGQGALMIDTPGMRELAGIGVTTAIGDSFPEIEALSARCLFSDCAHVSEKGCAVMHAVVSGDLEAERLNSYRKLKTESDYHEMSYAEKREKDRKFGRFVADWKKNHKKFES
jgi:ribosome biogenesis GTPase